ncbi:MAG: hypothetical protein IPJ20_14335 [Flammeovirgaceae bacterium]|nr:hypothetical protein [Flammeovirgaceae bacterium]
MAGSLTITKALLTATVDNQSKTYGAVNPVFTISYLGFANSETSSVLETPPTASAAVTPTSPVGTYAITATGGLDNNYTFSFLPGTLTITKASLTATANNQSRAYGAANPSLTINYAGFVNSETSAVLDTPPTTSTGAVATSGVGDYPINISGGSDDNYDFNYVPGTLTITKAILTATVDNQSKTYGAVNPVFTISYLGFANSETSSVLETPPTASAAVTPTSPVGTYVITASGGLDNNYLFSFSSGTLSITKVSLTATAANASRLYGAANPSLTINYAGFVNSETSIVLDTHRQPQPVRLPHR